MKRKLSTQLVLGFTLIVLITVALISLAANLLINWQFEKYVENQQREFSDSLAKRLGDQYDTERGTWNLDYVHGFGMYALDDGYIIRLYDASGESVWDAENHDMTLCRQIMQDISLQMKQKMPELAGDFVTSRYELNKNGNLVGYADISYYSPYYFKENEFRFVDSLNQILFVIGMLSVVGAVLAGALLAGRISRPITEITKIAGEISEGNYGIRLEEDARTKELADLTQAVNHMALSLGEQEMLRRRLTTDIAHELRTPLANVSSNLEAIIEGVWQPTTERLQSCYEELGRLSGIVADLEKLRQIESENLKLHKESVDLLELAETVRDAFLPELHKKQLNCQMEGGPVIVSGDKKRLYQVVSNLLSNAVKYSDEGGTILLKVQEFNGNGMLLVEDHGIGIPEKDQSLIFERFYRTDCSRQRKTGGVGIGLTIVKAIIQAHNGRISVESKEGRGTVFTVVLPSDTKER